MSYLWKQYIPVWNLCSIDMNKQQNLPTEASKQWEPLFHRTTLQLYLESVVALHIALVNHGFQHYEYPHSQPIWLTFKIA